MSTDEREINYDDEIDDFDEEILNSSIIDKVHKKYREKKIII